MTDPILVTGAAGFIGANFVRHCNQLGRSVLSVDKASYFSERREHRGIDFGTTCEPSSLFDSLAQFPKLAGIVHLGACTDTTCLDINYLRENNINYSMRLWEVATSRQIPFVYASSAATYGDGHLGYDDDEALLSRLKPLNPYGDSKHAFDLWALKQKTTPPAWSGFKFFNVYGYGERHKGTMASVFLHASDQLLKTGKIRLFKSERKDVADGEQKRDFVFIEDCISVLNFALEKPIARGIYNLGTGQARSFNELAAAVAHALSKPLQIEYFSMPESLATRYQYFTQALTQRLSDQGYQKPFLQIEEGARQYMEQII